MQALKWTLIAFYAIGTFAYISLIGTTTERTRGGAIFNTIANAAMIVWILNVM